MKKLIKFLDFGDSFFGVVLGAIVYFILITIAVCLFLGLLISITYIVFLDADIFESAIYTLNPAEHLLLRIGGLVAMAVSFILYLSRDEV